MIWFPLLSLSLLGYLSWSSEATVKKPGCPETSILEKGHEENTQTDRCQSRPHYFSLKLLESSVLTTWHVTEKAFKRSLFLDTILPQLHERLKPKLPHLTQPLLNSWPKKPSEILKNHLCCFKPWLLGVVHYPATDNGYRSLSQKLKTVSSMCP